MPEYFDLRKVEAFLRIEFEYELGELGREFDISALAEALAYGIKMNLPISYSVENLDTEILEQSDEKIGWRKYVGERGCLSLGDETREPKRKEATNGNGFDELLREAQKEIPPENIHHAYAYLVGAMGGHVPPHKVKPIIAGAVAFVKGEKN